MTPDTGAHRHVIIISIGASSSAGLEAIAAHWQRANASTTTTSADKPSDTFAALDSDGDRILSRDEFDAAWKSAQSFDMAGMPTQHFAGLRGAPPQEQGDRIQSLDKNDDGSVSADEFGLDGASNDVKALFKAIDSDGSGALSTDEIESFREQFMQKTGEAGGRPHGAHSGPPPGPPSGASGSASKSDDSTCSSTASISSADDTLCNFLQQLAEMFASQYSQVANTSAQSSSTSRTLSATA